MSNVEVAVYLNKIIMKFLKSKRLGNHFKRINKTTDGGARGWRVRTLTRRSLSQSDEKTLP